MTSLSPFTLRMMTLADLDAVSRIDQMSFTLPWSKNTYLYEILENQNAHMVVVTVPSAVALAEAKVVMPPTTSLNGFQKVLHRFGITKMPAIRADPSEAVVGMGGFWCAVGEAHISTIAVDPAWRGRSLGEVLLTGMIRRGIALGAVESVLEVRVSNQVAISLYRKYEYETLTLRTRYYRDDGEDALLMRADLAGDYRQRLAARMQALYARVPVIDRVNREVV